MFGFMKTVLRTEVAPLAGVCFLARNYLQRRRYKIKRKVSLFSPSPPVYLAFTVVLSLFSSFLHGLSEPEKSSEIQVKPTGSASFS